MSFIVAGVLLVGIAVLWPRFTSKNHLAQTSANPNIPSSAIPSYLGRKEMERQAGFIKQADNLNTTIRESGRTPIKHQHQTELEDATHEEALATKELNTALAKGAQSSNMTVADFSAFTAFVAREDIRLQARAIEFAQDNDDITNAQLEELGLNDRITERLFKAYELRKELEQSTNAADKDKLERLTKNITQVEAILDARLERQVQEEGGNAPARISSKADA